VNQWEGFEISDLRSQISDLKSQTSNFRSETELVNLKLKTQANPLTPKGLDGTRDTTVCFNS